MKKEIKLPWADKIRERIREKPWSKEVLEFIEPIILYATKEEKFLSEFYDLPLEQREDFIFEYKKEQKCAEPTETLLDTQ